MCASHNCHIISGSKAVRAVSKLQLLYPNDKKSAAPLNILFQAPPRHVHAACPESPETLRSRQLRL